MINRNESIGGYGGGFPFMGGGCGGYGNGWGGIAPIGLFGVLPFGDGFGRGRRDGENGGMGCCCDVRADIGETKFKVAEAGFNNAMQGKDNTFQIEKELFGLQSNLANCCCEGQKTTLAVGNGLEKSILAMGYQNQLANCEQTNVLTRQIADCCCNTNLAIERMGHEIQLRDAACCCELQKQHDAILCAIKDAAKDEELSRLRDERNRCFIVDELRRFTATAATAAA